MEGVSELADAVLPVIRTHADLWRWSASNEHGRQMHDAVAMLQSAAQNRRAVLDRDVEAIIRTDARDRRVAAWLQNTPEALAEIGEFELAIDWARQALDIGPAHQSRKAGEYWCRLLAEHRPVELLRRAPVGTRARRAARSRAAVDDVGSGILSRVLSDVGGFAGGIFGV